MKYLDMLLPNNWNFVNLDSICEKPQYGLTASSLPSGNVKFLRITDIKDFGVNWDKVPYCNCPKSDLYKYLLNTNDIVFARIGATTGKSYIIKDPPKAIFASYLIRIRAKSSTDPDYLSFFLKSDKYWRQINVRKNDNLKKGVSASILKSLILPLPPLSEQQKIAHILSTVQRAIEQQERLIQITTELKKALMHKLFTEGTRGEPQKETDPSAALGTGIGLVPESWEIIKIGSLGKCITGTTPSTKVEAYYDNAECDFIAPADLGFTKYIYNSERKISKKGLDVTRPLPKESVMCVCIGSSIGKVGMTWKETSSTNQQINSIVCNDKNSAHFIYYLLSYYSEYWKGFSTFGPVPILNKNRFESIDIPFPTEIEEQEEIATSLSIIDNKIEFHQKKFYLLKELFQTLLHQLMTAQIRVHEIEFEGNFSAADVG